MFKHFLPKCRRSGIERSKGIAEQNLITMFFHFAFPERIKRLICVPVLVQTLRLSSVRLLTVKLKQAFYNNMNIAASLDGPIVRGWTLSRLCGTVQKLHLSRDICIESMEELREE